MFKNTLLLLFSLSFSLILLEVGSALLLKSGLTQGNSPDQFWDGQIRFSWNQPSDFSEFDLSLVRAQKEQNERREQELVGEKRGDIKRRNAKRDGKLPQGIYSRFTETLLSAPSEKIIYRATYSYIDSQKTRWIPSNPKAAEDKVGLLFIGGSFMFGEGLDDSVSLPNLVVSQLPESYGHMMANGGWSLNDVLLQTERGTPSRIDLIETKESILVYLLTNSQLRRFVGVSSLLGKVDWAKEKAHYTVSESGEPTYMGSFSDSQPEEIALYRKIHSSSFIQLSGFSWPYLPTKTQVHNLLSLLEELKSRIEKKTVVKKVVLVVPPGMFKKQLKLIWAEIGRLKQQDPRYELYDLSKFPIGVMTENHWKIPIDGHPTAASNWVLSQAIAQRLKKEMPQKKKKPLLWSEEAYKN